MVGRNRYNDSSLSTTFMLEEILELTKENNRMLKEIIHFINVYLASTTKENQNDFEHNILANLISSHMTRF